MALKTFCDICDREIKVSGNAGIVTWNEKIYSIDNTGNLPMNKQVSKFACEDCFKKIKRFFTNAKPIKK